MKENRLSNNNYGVFCIAAQLEQNNRELDVLWDKALKLYDEFRNSKFNNPEESELECINEFLNKKTAEQKQIHSTLEKLDGSRPCSKCELDVDGGLWDSEKLLLTWKCNNGHENSLQVH